MLTPSPSSEPSNVSVLLLVSSCVVSKTLLGAVLSRPEVVDVLYTHSAILTRIQCVGLLTRFQKKVRYEAGMGVVMSPGVYRRLIGNIFVVDGAVSSDGLKASIPLPFVVVHSGKTTITRFGCCLSSDWRSTSLLLAGGSLCGC
jgi:hypothetical protein